MSKEIIIAQITFRDKMVNDLCNKMKSSLVSRTLLIIFFDLFSSRTLSKVGLNRDEVDQSDDARAVSAVNL